MLSQTLATQHANADDTQAHSCAGGPQGVQGSLARADVGEADEVVHADIAAASSSVEAWPGKTYPNKQISTKGTFHVPLRQIVLLMS